MAQSEDSLEVEAKAAAEACKRMARQDDKSLRSTQHHVFAAPHRLTVLPHQLSLLPFFIFSKGFLHFFIFDSTVLQGLGLVVIGSPCWSISRKSSWCQSPGHFWTC